MPQAPLEIERRFIVATPPRGLTTRPCMEIRQGYLVVEENREVRIRQRDLSCTLTVKEGHGLVRSETEVSISVKQFETLWPLTEGRRIGKKRYALTEGSHVIEVDRFSGSLRPLCIAEVEFDSVASSKTFIPPAYCTEEITGRPEYHNASLALHGLPYSDQGSIRAAALPYLVRNGDLHLVLITSRNGNNWILPKGHLEKHLPRSEVALMEAVEEAGVIGVLQDFRSRCTTTNNQVHHIYPVKVSTLLKQWPEMGERKRRVFVLEKALAKLQDQNVAQCVKRMVEKLA